MSHFRRDLWIAFGAGLACDEQAAMYFHDPVGIRKMNNTFSSSMNVLKVRLAVKHIADSCSYCFHSEIWLSRITT